MLFVGTQGNNRHYKAPRRCTATGLSFLDPSKSCFLPASFGKMYAKTRNPHRKKCKVQNNQTVNCSLWHCAYEWLFSWIRNEQDNFANDMPLGTQYWQLDCWDFSCFKTSLKGTAGFQWHETKGSVAFLHPL